MKLNQATVVAFLSATLATSAAGSEHEEMKDKIASLLVAPKIHRMLEGLSAECSADTEAFAIEFSTDVAYAMASCPQGIVLSGNTATIDFSVCDPQFTESVTTACTAVNGIIVSGIGDVRMNCSVKGQSITVVSKEVPECLANSCDVSNWEAEKANYFKSGEIEAAFSAELGASCSIHSAGSKVTGVLALALTSFAAAALMFF